MFHQFQPQVSYGIALKPLSGSRLLHLWLHRRKNLMNGIPSLKRESKIERYRGIKTVTMRSYARGVSGTL